MKVKDVKLEWYVMNYDFNSRKLERVNVLQFRKEDIANQVRTKKINNIKELKDYLKREFMYHYWSKTEAEILVGGLFSKSLDEFEKIDIWYQLEKNLDRITEYVNSAMEIFTAKDENEKEGADDEQ